MQGMPFGDKKDVICTTLLILLLCIGIYALEYFWLLPGYFLIKFLFAGTFSFLGVLLVKYLSSCYHVPGSTSSEILIERNRHYLIIVVSIIFTYSPFLTEGYYWYDDFWFYIGNHAFYGITASLPAMRPYHGLLGELFWFVSPSNAYYIKWFSIACALGYAFMIYSWLFQKSGQRFLSLAITLAVSLFSPLSDHIGYSSTIAILPAMLSSGFSVILFDSLSERARSKEWGDVVVLVAASGCALLFSFMLYQVATPIVFLFLLIYVYFNQQPSSSMRFCLSYMSFFGLCAVLYLILNKLIIAHYGASVWSRGNIIGMQDIVPKVQWFLQTVMPAVFDRLGLSFLGRGATSDKCYWYFVQYSSTLLRNSVSILFTASIIAVCCSFILRRRKFVDLLLVIGFIPMSYFCFLILKENSYLTYYAIPILSVIMFFFIIAIKETIELLRTFRGIGKVPVNPDPILQIFLTLLICLLAFQNNIYIRQFWVETNKEGYGYLKNTLSLQAEKKKKIHVFGVLTPGQGNIYSVFATKWALRELEYNPEDYVITASDNDRMISIIQADLLEGVKKNITPDELNLLLSNYRYDATYSVYRIIGGQDLSSSKRLTEILIKTGLLPGDYSQTAVVDLQWIKPTWSSEKKNFEVKLIANMDQVVSYPKNIIANVDIIDYSKDEDFLHIGGWAAMENIDSTKSHVSIILRSSTDKCIQLSGNMLDSPDVAASFKNKKYGKCRFDLSLYPMSPELSPGKYEVWIYIVNNKLKLKASLLWSQYLEIK